MLKTAVSGVLDTREVYLVKRVSSSTVQMEGFTFQVERFMFSQLET
jgi:hypothetical protein